MEAPLAIDVAGLQAWRRQDPDLQLLDVREDWEHALCALPGDLHMPMQTVPARLAELDRARPVAVLCHHGGRSLQVTHFLRRQGFAATNVDGGIDAWARQIDPSMATY